MERTPLLHAIAPGNAERNDSFGNSRRPQSTSSREKLRAFPKGRLVLPFAFILIILGCLHLTFELFVKSGKDHPDNKNHQSDDNAEQQERYLYRNSGMKWDIPTEYAHCAAYNNRKFLLPVTKCNLLIQ